MSKEVKSLKEQLESVINENQKLLEKHFQQDSKIVKLIEDNEYYKNQLQQKENIIKEVREYIEKLLREEIEITDKNSVDYGMKFQRAYFSDSELGKVLEILDKGE